jgi:hypothetical protein
MADADADFLPLLISKLGPELGSALPIAHFPLRFALCASQTRSEFQQFIPYMTLIIQTWT